MSDPNCSSPANVDAGVITTHQVMYRNDRESYNAIVKAEVQNSKRNIPMELETSIAGN